jgi:hypothetical protein
MHTIEYVKHKLKQGDFEFTRHTFKKSMEVKDLLIG